MTATIQQNQLLALIVDDEPFFRTVLRLFLEQDGYRVAEAENGTEAINVFEQLHPDIILLDISMPDMDGFECCYKLHSSNQGQHTPILMLTSVEDERSINRAFAAGATDYVTKPVLLPILRQRLKRLIEQSQLQQKLIAANQQLQLLVNLDELTQVANRRRFEEYLFLEWQRQTRSQQPLSLILCDVDFFKSYNDTYGHLAGDRTLVKIARAIKDALKRTADLVARYGGEEFAVVLPDTDALGAIHIAKTICCAVRTLAIPHRNSLLCSYITLSAGSVTVVPQPNSDFQQIIATADRALYQAKAAGRDRFIHSSLDSPFANPTCYLFESSTSKRCGFC
ncbi:MAG: PleD family two-component system response regulator [Komarekiella atlantica HA4396-MV6]|jgi:diguanylate cyclase (GGDEF)-like protein|nr:PleD family two-component system response regulator [Komarekiella atlantica HA4396-MV6]